MPSNSAICWRATAFAFSASFCVLLCAEPAEAKATYTTFDAGWVASINNSNTVTGLAPNFVDSFIRTVDGTVTTFAVPGAIVTEANGINDEGAVVGDYANESGPAHGFVRAADGTITMFDVRGTSALPLAINNKGEIAGYYYSRHHGHGFVRAARGKIKVFDVAGSPKTWASSINDKGVIAGNYTADTGDHGFVRAADGTMTTFEVPGAAATYPSSINIKGTIAGWYFDDSGNPHSFVRSSDGTITTFDAPGCNGEPTGINRKDVIAGVCERGVRRLGYPGFIRHPDGHVQTFHVPGSHGMLPTCINDAGVISGIYTDENYVQRGFLRFPSLFGTGGGAASTSSGE